MSVIKAYYHEINKHLKTEIMNLKHMSLKVDLQWAHGTEDSKTGWKENQTDEKDDTERKKREREKEERIRLWSLNKHWLKCIKKNCYYWKNIIKYILKVKWNYKPMTIMYVKILIHYHA